MTDPRPTDPRPTDPRPTDPRPTDPRPTGPASTNGAAPAGITLSDEALATLLAAWLPGQRWFATHSSGIVPRVVQRAAVATQPDGSAVEHLLVQAQTPTGEDTYQLFVALRHDVPQRLAHAVIGAADGVTACDALHDSEFTSLLLRDVASGQDLGPLRCRTEPGAVIDAAADGMVIGAEQSNTSVVYGTSSILKVFRRVEPGVNPDVEAHRALRLTGSANIAQLLGEVGGSVQGEPTTLAMLSEYFANSAEGWAMATASVRDLMSEGDLHAGEVGGDFAAESGRLGAAVAAVHTDLAEAFGTSHVGRDDLLNRLDAMTGRAVRLATGVPELTPHLAAIRDVFAAAADGAAGLTVQRIHGDLHLGQVLRTLRGWVVIDFEGEPEHPVAYRRRPHSVLKDIAGMLRSFDYAAHHQLIGPPEDAQRAYRATEWADRNRKAFCAGYAEVAHSDPRQAADLLRAYELDKAIYELAYEHAHRPAWAVIPMHAIAMLTGRRGSA